MAPRKTQAQKITPQKEEGPDGKIIKRSPTALTPAVQQEVCAHIKRGVPVEYAAARAGISRTTYYRWIKQGENEEYGIYHDFALAVRQAEAECMDRYLQVIENSTTPDSKNWLPAMTFLERRFPKDFSKREKIETEISGPGGKPIEFNPYDELARRLASIASKSGRTPALPTGDNE